jgi:hypothetical protein
MTRKLFIAIIIFVLTIAGKLSFDIHLYFAGGVNNHIEGPIIVFICLIGCSLLGGFTSIPMWPLVYWPVFDTLYALFIGQGPFYIGTTAKLDILQHDYPVLQVLKYVLAIASIVFFLKARKKLQ